MTSLELANVHKGYGLTRALKGISLQVPDGEFLSLLGPSGCGKTTTLNIVAGFLQPDEGTVLLGDVDVTRRPPYKRDSSIVFQNYALFPHMSVWDNVAYGLAKRRLPKAELKDRVSGVLALLGIAHLAERYPRQLSGGQQQRVAVARAIAVRPGVLLLDEPLSNLDKKLRTEVRLQLRQLQLELGQTALFVTHDQEEALTMSDRIAVMRDGVIEQLGSPAELYEHPRSVFVAGFMGIENILPVHRDGAETSIGGFFHLRAADLDAWEYVGVRPSQVSVSAHEAPWGSDGITGQARVASKTYLGGGFRLELQEPRGGDTLVAEVPMSVSELQVGDLVAVSVRRDSLLPLVGDGAPTDTSGPESDREPDAEGLKVATTS